MRERGRAGGSGFILVELHLFLLARRYKYYLITESRHPRCLMRAPRTALGATLAPRKTA